MLKLSFTHRLFAALSDGKRQAIAKKYGLEEAQVAEMAESLDPTKNCAYTDWICREFKAGTLDINTVKDTLTQFDRVKQSPQFTGAKNIFDWKAPDLTAQFQKKWREQQKEMSKGDIETKLKTEGLPGAKLILNSGPWKIWRVVKPEYAVILGSKTRWCTAQLGTAQHYCSRGPLYPIWKDGKPWAQGHVGERGLEFHNEKNEDLPLNADTFDLLARAKDIPQIQVLFDAALRDSTDMIDTKMEKEIERFILDTDNFHMLQTYLKTHFWDEGWELVLDVGNKSTIEDILSNMGPKAKEGFSASPIFTEILNMEDIKLPENMLTELIGLGRVEDYIKGSGRVWLVPVKDGGLKKEYADKVREYIVNLINTTDPKDKVAVKTLTTLMDKVGFGKTDYKKIVLPYWKKFFVEGKKKPKMLPHMMHYEMMNIPEYAEAFKTDDTDGTVGVQATIPSVGYGADVRFTLLPGKWGRDVWFDYQQNGRFLNCRRSSTGDNSNRAIFNTLGLRTEAFVSQAYGYAAGEGDWPTTRDGGGPESTAALTRVVNALRPYCSKIKVNTREFV